MNKIMKLKSLISSKHGLLTNNKYPNIHFGFIDLYLDGGYTGIRGLSLDDIERADNKNSTIDFKLNLYNKNNEIIGFALGSTKYGSSR